MVKYIALLARYVSYHSSCFLQYSSAVEYTTRISTLISTDSMNCHPYDIVQYELVLALEDAREVNDWQPKLKIVPCAKLCRGSSFCPSMKFPMNKEPRITGIFYYWTVCSFSVTIDSDNTCSVQAAKTQTVSSFRKRGSNRRADSIMFISFSSYLGRDACLCGSAGSKFLWTR